MAERGSLAWRAEKSGSATLAATARSSGQTVRRTGGDRKPTPTKSIAEQRRERAKAKIDVKSGEEKLTVIDGQPMIVGRRASGEKYVRGPSSPKELRAAKSLQVKTIRQERIQRDIIRPAIERERISGMELKGRRC